MIIRVASRLVLLLASLALATALVVAALSALASTAPAEATPLLERDQFAAVERAIEAPATAEQAADSSPSPAVVLVFAGIVLLAVLPPAHRIHIYHRSYHHSDWF